MRWALQSSEGKRRNMDSIHRVIPTKIPQEAGKLPDQRRIAVHHNHITTFQFSGRSLWTTTTRRDFTTSLKR
jgi:hypothetical protein